MILFYLPTFQPPLTSVFSSFFFQILQVLIVHSPFQFCLPFIFFSFNLILSRRISDCLSSSLILSRSSSFAYRSFESILKSLSAACIIAIFCLVNPTPLCCALIVPLLPFAPPHCDFLWPPIDFKDLV